MFYKIADQFSLKSSVMKNKEKVLNDHILEQAKEVWQLSAMLYLESDPGTKKGHY